MSFLGKPRNRNLPHARTGCTGPTPCGCSCWRWSGVCCVVRRVCTVEPGVPPLRWPFCSLLQVRRLALFQAQQKMENGTVCLAPGSRPTLGLVLCGRRNGHSALGERSKTGTERISQGRHGCSRGSLSKGKNQRKKRHGKDEATACGYVQKVLVTLDRWPGSFCIILAFTFSHAFPSLLECRTTSLCIWRRQVVLSPPLLTS